MARQYDFELLRRLEPDAVGAPGRRKFRLIAENDRETAFLWMEKEQLQALGQAVDQLLTPIKPLWQREGESRAEAALPPTGGAASVEFQVGRLGLGYDEGAKLFILIAHDAESDSEEQPAFRCQVSRGQLAHLSESIRALSAAGRPRCPVCGSPIESEPHFCPGSNGHSHHD
ncbi:MAG TPA: DUF3090 family protein [Chloroflexota bacterium]|nr:DUF3090 family protein [Chloroflexota bacterium]